MVAAAWYGVEAASPLASLLAQTAPPEPWHVAAGGADPAVGAQAGATPLARHLRPVTARR